MIQKAMQAVLGLRSLMGFKILRTGFLLYRTYNNRFPNFTFKINYLIVSAKFKNKKRIKLQCNNTQHVACTLSLR